MAWLRSGDEAATYPQLMSVMGMEGVDNRTLNELAGFVWRAATMAAAHWTDYVMDLGTLMMLGNGRHEELIRLAVSAGLFEWITVDGVRKVKLIEDAHFLHMLSKEGTEWERTRDRDNRDPSLKAPVILRDGDNCRWCGAEVYWSGPKGNRKATLDHLHPGEAGTVDTMVVCCTLCNSTRQDDLKSWTEELLPPPPHPHYGAWSRRYMEDHLRSDMAPHASTGAPAGLDTNTSDAPSVGALAGVVDDPGAGGGGVEPGVSEGIPEEVDPGTADRGASAGPRSGGPGAASPARPGGVSEGIPEEVDPGTADRGASAGPRSGGPGAEGEPSAGRSRVGGKSPDQSPTRAIGNRDSPGRDGTGRADPGRVGSGRDWTGRAGLGGATPGGSGNRRRRKRR